MPAVRRPPLDSSPIALPLDEVAYVPGHLGDQQAHRDVGESETKGERYDQCQPDDEQCGE